MWPAIISGAPGNQSLTFRSKDWGHKSRLFISCCLLFTQNEWIHGKSFSFTGNKYLNTYILLCQISSVLPALHPIIFKSVSCNPWTMISTICGGIFPAFRWDWCCQGGFSICFAVGDAMNYTSQLQSEHDSVTLTPFLYHFHINPRPQLKRCFCFATIFSFLKD